jgi:hypothetical protein
MATKELFAEAFFEAEKHIKRAGLLILSTVKKTLVSEEEITGLLIPAVNELRYAGYHAAKALTAVSIEDAEKAYEAAIKHCHRSSYDSLEASFQFCLKECGTFRNDYRLVQIAPIMPSYAADCICLNKIKAALKIQQDKETYYKDIEEHLVAISEILERWNAHREDLNKGLADARRNRLFLILGAATFLAALLGIFL